ncbi:uncharacterized protein KD926_001270 [Aspergillus affinis]|uniref:uncharacterized protein n=1 Tax=Aspergillus affinis TaxID=1070780 RepID=UPI0022FEF7F1|nr:uncharacterized protein KD926_001270 [Aspergillus affinis]KAI9036814.1 hypothetical protein KD926_001270 [Aspergillus affinis]
MHNHILLSLCLSTLLTLTSASQKCYLMDGTSAPTLSPCEPPSSSTSTSSSPSSTSTTESTTKHSACCPLRPTNASSTAICLSKSGLCLSSNGLIYESGCTDPTWQDSACPFVCPDARSNWKGKALENRDWKQGQVVDHWQVMTCAPKKVCCRRFSGGEGCCGNRSLWITEFEVGMPRFRVWEGEGVDESLDGSLGGDGDGNATVTGGRGGATATGSCDSESAGAEGKEVCREATVGAAVGAPLGAAFVATLAALAWAIRKQKITEKRLRGVEAQVQTQPPSLVSSPGYYKEDGARQVQRLGNHAELDAIRQYELDGRPSA